VKILATLAVAHDHGRELTAKEIGGYLEVRPLVAAHRLARLRRAKLVGDSLIAHEDPAWVHVFPSVKALKKKA
jgi:hypothetical protein